MLYYREKDLVWCNSCNIGQPSVVTDKYNHLQLRVLKNDLPSADVIKYDISDCIVGGIGVIK